MKIQAVKESFKKGQISKSEFIAKMHEFHRVLFDFAASLSDTEIEKIELSDNKVIFTSRKTDVHDGGLKFHCDINDPRITPVEAFNFDVYEQDDARMMYNLVKDGDTIFDIGANIGWYTNHLATKNPSSQIFAFEPIPKTFQQLRENVTLNAQRNIRLFNIALTNKKQKLTFFYSPNQTGASSLKNITERQDIEKVECDATTLDLFITENNISRLDFIKCDVEGAELFVYEGGRNTLERYRPIVFTEMLRKWAAKFEYHPNDIISLFRNLHYQCYRIQNGKLREVATVTDDMMETNFIFLHRDKHRAQINELTS